ncbi:hypothetical protein HYC85_011521 [Camellia sinensis]|uniref:RNA helicase n=1 Tax=Camellia sinensis TaxID=4442 RepID=A0A7J7HCE0_CAMSI|nr:hypothetical protein HYC85_011521 [Camellia sinensis]
MEEIGAFAGVQNEYPSFFDMQHVFNRKKLFRRRRNFEDGLRRIRKRDFEILSIVRNHLDEKGLAGRVVEWFDVVLMYEDCQKHADWYCQKGLDVVMLFLKVSATRSGGALRALERRCSLRRWLAPYRSIWHIHVREPEGDVLCYIDSGTGVGCGCVYSVLHLQIAGDLLLLQIAETSLTVDGVVYVIDSGYVKQRQYNPSTGMYSLDVVQISRVQADQHAGRAGRTLPGKCYRLYPSMVYNEELLDATVPEIQRSSLAGTVLYLKSLDLPDMDILKFDFLDSPSSESLEDALKQLYLIDAIDENGSISSIGRTMAGVSGFSENLLYLNAELPLEPSLSRTLMEANEYGCLSQALTVAAMLSAETTLLPGRK